MEQVNSSDCRAREALLAALPHERLLSCWFIEQGIEDVTTARARLVTEMSRLADLHGDPHGVLSRPNPGTPA
jgi:hypothetical protein